MTFSPTTRLALNWTALAAAALGVLWWLGPVLLPFVVAGVLAYALAPLVDALTRRRLPRPLAVALVELCAVLALLAVLLLIAPVLAHQLPAVKQQLPRALDHLGDWLEPQLAAIGLSVKLNVATVKAWLIHLLDGNGGDWAATLLDSARLGGSKLLALAGNAVLVPVLLFYLLLDWPRLTEGALQLVPPRLRPAVQGFVDDSDRLLRCWLRGQLLVMGLMAVFYSSGLMLAGLQLALPVGVFTGLAMAIPYLGYGLGLLLALMSALLQFGPGVGLLAVLGVYLLGQMVESFVLTPYLVGDRIGLGPLAVIFALLAFGQLFGFVGVLLALPLAALLSVAWSRLRLCYLDSRLYRG